MTEIRKQLTALFDDVAGPPRLKWSASGEPEGRPMPLVTRVTGIVSLLMHSAREEICDAITVIGGG